MNRVPEDCATRLKVLRHRRDVRARHLPLAAMRALFALWREAADAARSMIPALGDLDQAELERLAPDLTVLEVADGGRDYLYLHHGSNIALHLGRNLAGQRVSDMRAATARHYLDLLAELREHPVPIYCRAEAAPMSTVDYWDRLLLPLARADGELEHVVIHDVARAWRVAPDRYLELARYLNHVEQGLCVVNERGNVLQCNRALLDMYGAREPELSDGMSFEQLQRALAFPIELPLEPDTSVPHPEMTLSGRAARTVSAETMQTTPDGRSLQVAGVRLSDGGVAVTVTDVTAATDARTELRAARDDLELTVRARTEQLESTVGQLEATLLAIADGVVSTDASGRVVMMNSAAERIIGCDAGRASGRPIDEVLHLVDEETGNPARCVLLDCLQENRARTGTPDTLLVRACGDRINVLQRAAPMAGPAGECIGAVLVFSDVTMARAAEKKAIHAASHDELTGLANRAAIMSRMGDLLLSNERYGVPYALLFIDLDHFKPVNDVEGHAAGDRFLRDIAGALKSRARRSDLVGRIGGDEFVMLLEHCDLGDATRIALDVSECVRRCELRGSGRVHYGSASIGIDVIEVPGATRASHLEFADRACYAAKQAGGNRVYRWDADSGASHPVHEPWRGHTNPAAVSRA